MDYLDTKKHHQRHKNEIWHVVLKEIKKPATQELLKEWTWVISLNKSSDGLIAEVGVTSERLIELIRTKRDDIAMAFETIYQMKTEVKIEYQPKPEEVKEKEKESTTFQLAKEIISRAIERLNGRTRSLIKENKITISQSSIFLQIRIEAPSEAIFKQTVKRAESLTRRLEKGLSTFIISFCTEENLIPFFHFPKDGKIERVFSINEVNFYLVKNFWDSGAVHVIPQALEDYFNLYNLDELDKLTETEDTLPPLP